MRSKSPAQGKPMNYIQGHWRGGLSLGISFWINVFLLITIIGILGSLANISQYWQVYKETYQIGASKEEIGNYSVELKKNNTLIHVIGGLALGISKEVPMLLKSTILLEVLY